MIASVLVAGAFAVFSSRYVAIAGKPATTGVSARDKLAKARQLDRPPAVSHPALALRPSRKSLPATDRNETAEAAELAWEEFIANELGDHLQQRTEEIRREQLVKDRFDTAVASGGYETSQMHPAILSLFETVQLKTLATEDGTLSGLEIEALEPGSALIDAGFTVGDRLTRINDTVLHDPADLPALIVALGPELTICGEHAGAELCAHLNLD